MRIGLPTTRFVLGSMRTPRVDRLRRNPYAAGSDGVEGGPSPVAIPDWTTFLLFGSIFASESALEFTTQTAPSPIAMPLGSRARP